jgi:hypothetical protein
LRSDSGEIYEAKAKGICINFSRGISAGLNVGRGNNHLAKMTRLLLLLAAKSKESVFTVSMSFALMQRTKDQACLKIPGFLQEFSPTRQEPFLSHRPRLHLPAAY